MLKPGDIVTYVCREFEHNALMIDFNGDDKIRLIHVVTYNGRSLPQVELNVPKDKPDVDGRYFKEK